MHRKSGEVGVLVVLDWGDWLLLMVDEAGYIVARFRLICRFPMSRQSASSRECFG